MAPGAMIRAALLALALAPVADPAAAQDTGPLLILDQEELFLRSQFGQRMREDIAVASGELAAENRQIEARLVAEEQELTDKRDTLPVDEFRALAKAFDEKVTALRTEQDAKARALSRSSDEAQARFFTRVAEILSQIMRERGAVAILDQRVVFLSAEVIDITDVAVSRIDAALGDGTAAGPSEPGRPEPAEGAPTPPNTPTAD
ncbi:OmpH family outer membrane protein [Oceaniglobus trochenteri]|uniref:OmpH family outer membrane protein n=1 Tax=Oceaniglobus trochenteri TaxID=2763260 RepID=UPI001CFFF9AF|nr:OmpH family outer membrane protein [Oceaniglobus trochenteri]